MSSFKLLPLIFCLGATPAFASGFCQNLLASVRAIGANLPKSGRARGRALDAIEVAHLDRSEALGREIAWYRAYDVEGTLLAESEIEIGEADGVERPAAHFKDFYRDKIALAGLQAKVAVFASIHTHPESGDPWALRHRFSYADQLFGRRMKTIMHVTTKREDVEFENYFIYRSARGPRKHGYRIAD